MNDIGYQFEMWLKEKRDIAHFMIDKRIGDLKDRIGKETDYDTIRTLVKEVEKLKRSKDEIHRDYIRICDGHFGCMYSFIEDINEVL